MRNVTFKITCTVLAENLPRVLPPKKQCFKTVPGLDNLLTSLKIFWSKLFKEFFTSGSWGGSSGSCTFLAHWDLGGKLLVQNFNYFLFRVLNSKQGKHSNALMRDVQRKWPKACQSTVLSTIFK